MLDLRPDRGAEALARGAAYAALLRSALGATPAPPGPVRLLAAHSLPLLLVHRQARRTRTQEHREAAVF